jgi:Family of unknown function (DUF5397)
MATAARAREAETADVVDMGVLAGSIRRFGLEGPPYEVVGPAATGADGRARMRVRVLESGEELDYPVEDLAADPCEV